MCDLRLEVLGTAQGILEFVEAEVGEIEGGEINSSVILKRFPFQFHPR